MTVQQQETKFGEIHKKRCLVGYLILTEIGAILAIKFYLLPFVMGLTLGICSLFTIFFTFHNILGNRVSSNRKKERGSEKR
ncbi:MAG TPA: hypothetical protein VFJ05_06910 [Nitrososphaeraceae archaeon]|nr:hypothetical protein [Nitrososphaeraceae archaeon]